MADVNAAYYFAQSFKYHHADGIGDLDQLTEIIRQRLRAQTGSADSVAVDATLKGMAWITALCARYRIPLPDLMDVPEAIVTNVVANLAGSAYAAVDPNHIRLGAGAGFFTGLLVGLDIAEQNGAA